MNIFVANTDGRMESIEFSQTHYLKRAEEMGISLYLSPSPPQSSSRSLHEHNNAREAKSITMSPRAFQDSSTKHANQALSNTKVARQSAVAEKRRVGDAWDGHIRTFPPSKNVDKSSDWEWNKPVPEIIQDFVWSEDEDVKATTKSSGKINQNDCGGRVGGVFNDTDRRGTVFRGRNEGKDEKITDDADDDKKPNFMGRDGVCGNGCVPGGKSIAPRGKSWMIVTQKLLDAYSP
jgi:hypothetical protein